MYTDFYGFSEKPFNLTPDPKFLFLAPSHREALASMIYGIRERRGFVSVTGEVGTGKTTLIYALLSSLGDRVKTVYIFHTQITFEELLKTIFHELALPLSDPSKSGMLRQLYEYLIELLNREEILAVIIDEAQNLPREVMEELRLLSNLETAKSKLLQIVLVGQPELETKLNAEDLRQLKQRIGIRREITPLSEKESGEYLEHRLKLAGSTQNRVFTSEAAAAICEYSGGVPRTINIVCDNAFLIGYSASQKKITAEIVQQVIRDLEGTLGSKPIHSAPVADRARPLPAALPVKRFYSRRALPMLVGLALVLGALLAREYLVGTAPGKHAEKRVSVAKIKPPPAAPKAVPAPVVQAALSPIETTTEAPTPPSSLAEPVIAAPTPPVAPAPDASIVPKTSVKIREVITVAKGDNICRLARHYYHRENVSVIDLLLKANPAITDVHLIKVRQRVRLPEIREEAMIIPGPNSTCRIHVGTFETPAEADVYADEPALAGRKIEVIPQKVSTHDTWYRVLIGVFQNEEEGLRTLRLLKEKGLLPALSS